MEIVLMYLAGAAYFIKDAMRNRDTRMPAILVVLVLLGLAFFSYKLTV